MIIDIFESLDTEFLLSIVENNLNLNDLENDKIYKLIVYFLLKNKINIFISLLNLIPNVKIK